MAKHNVFSTKGIKPTFDVYQISATALEGVCQEILKSEYGLDNEVWISQSEEGPSQEVRFEIENAEDIEDNHWRVHERMINEGFDPTDSNDVYNAFSFKIGGGQDTWIEWVGDVNGTNEVRVFINPRQDVEIKVLEVMDTALDGTREETVAALSKLLREVCL